MLTGRAAVAGIVACVLLTPALPAQQHAGYPLCGIVSIDTLKETQGFVRVHAWREEPIEQELQHLRAMLRDSLKHALRAAAREAAATEGPKRGRSTGDLQLQIGIGQPHNGLAPVGGSWLLLLRRFPDSTGYQPQILGWHFRGPLQLVAADSAINGAKMEGLRLIADLVGHHLKVCRHMRDTPLTVQGASNRPLNPRMQPTGRGGPMLRSGGTPPRSQAAEA